MVGSLSLRRSPCVRKTCPDCLSGEQHASYVLYGRRKGRRFAVYVPKDLSSRYDAVWTTSALCRNLYQAVPRYVKVLKQVWLANPTAGMCIKRCGNVSLRATAALMYLGASFLADRALEFV